MLCALGVLDQATRDFARALAIDPTYGPAYAGRAWVRQAFGDYTGAVRDAQYGLGLDPEQSGLYYARLGAAYQSLQQYTAALAAYNQILHQHPGQPETLYDRGGCYLAMGEYEPALADFDQALELDPTWVQVFPRSAVFYLRRGAPAQADAECARAQARHPRELMIYVFWGAAYQARGRIDHAIAVLEQGLAVTPRPRQRQVVGRRVQALRAAQRAQPRGSSRRGGPA
jgi:tetratricopeptide (TPR) repeat protein